MNLRFILIFIRLAEFTMIRDHNMRDRNARTTIKLPLLYYTTSTRSKSIPSDNRSYSSFQISISISCAFCRAVL